MPLPTFNKGTRPSMSIPAPVFINTTGWTQIWGADPTRSFATVLGGTGALNDDFYVTANPLAVLGGPDVATFSSSSPFYLETRGTNALYARRSAAVFPGSTIEVRTAVAHQVNKVPYPSGLVGTKNYHIETSCGHKTLIYSTGTEPTWAIILPEDPARVRATVLSTFDAQMFIGPLQNVLKRGVEVNGAQVGFMSSAPGFPGFVCIEGPAALIAEKLNFVPPIHLMDEAHWVVDRMVA